MEKHRLIKSSIASFVTCVKLFETEHAVSRSLYCSSHLMKAVFVWVLWLYWLLSPVIYDVGLYK